MEATAAYTRSTVFRDHPLIVTDQLLTAAAETTFAAGSVLMLSSGNAVLADDNVTTATLIGVLADETTLSTDAVLAPIVLHGDAILDKLTIEEGETPAVVAAILKAAGIYAY